MRLEAFSEEFDLQPRRHQLGIAGAQSFAPQPECDRADQAGENRQEREEKIRVLEVLRVTLEHRIRSPYSREDEPCALASTPDRPRDERQPRDERNTPQ